MDRYIDGVHVFDYGGYDDDEVREYIRQAKEQAKDDIQEITLTPYNETQVEIKFSTVIKKFERIRRITGKPTK